MATEKARIEAEMTGASQVAGEAGKIGDSLAKVGSVAEQKIGGALKTVGSALGGILTDGLRAAGIFQTISLASAVEEAKKLDAMTARLGQSAGTSGTKLKAVFEGMEKKALTSAPAIADVARALGRATYDARGSTDALAGLSQEALATGRTLDEELQLGVALRSGLGVVGDTTRELDRLREIAERTAQTGGHVAFKDSIASLQPLLAGVVTDTDQARGKIEALLAVLGKGLKPEAAKGVGAAALSQLRARALDIERATGKQVLNDNNELVDPTQNLRDIKRLAERRFGKNKAAMRRALMSDFGADLGLAIFRTDLSQVDGLAKASGSGKTAAEADQFRKSPAGKRLEQQVAKDSALRGAGEKLLAVHDAMVNNLGVPGTLLAEFGGGGLAAKGAWPMLKSVGGSLLSLLGAGATTGAAATVGFTAAGLIQMGKSTDDTMKESLDQHADIAGEGVAKAAMRSGDLESVWKQTHGVESVQQATLLALERMLTAQKEGNELLRQQVTAGIAVTFDGRAPSFSRDPNAPKEN